MLYKADILAICPTAKDDIVEAIVAGGYKGLWERFGISSPIAQAKFMGQVSVETGGLTGLVENLNYSAKRLCQVWPKRFPTLKDALPYANNPQALANKVYGGRMGNTKEGDGWRYRGRGLKQLTGFDNYKAEGEALGLDLIGDPDQVAKPDIAFLTALSYFQRHIGKAAETASVETITVAVNGGVNGLHEREVATERALEILEPNRLKKRPLEFGVKGLDVALLQASLVELGEKITIDSIFGKATVAAVKRFQGQMGAQQTGVYDAATRNELQIALQTARFKADPSITVPEPQPEPPQPLPDFPLEAAITLTANIVIGAHGDIMGVDEVQPEKLTKIKRYATVLWGLIDDLGDSRETEIAKQKLETAILWASKHAAQTNKQTGV